RQDPTPCVIQNSKSLQSRIPPRRTLKTANWPKTSRQEECAQLPTRTAGLTLLRTLTNVNVFCSEIRYAGRQYVINSRHFQHTWVSPNDRQSQCPIKPPGRSRTELVSHTSGTNAYQVK